MRRDIITRILVLMSVFLVSMMSVSAATLTCQQVSSTSLSIPQFSSKTVEVKCTASGGQITGVQITPNANPSTGLTISSTQSISSSISDQSSSTAKWSVTGDSPNDYTLSYIVSSSGTEAWTGASTTAVDVPAPAQLTVEYVLPPSIFTPTVETLDFKITNIGGTTATNVKMKLNSTTYTGSLVDFPTSIAAGASASYSWTNTTGFNTSGTYTTSVYIGEVFHDSATSAVQSTNDNISQEVGWNLLSLSKVPSDTDVSTIFSSIADNLTIVWYYNATDTGDHWKKYDPDGNPEANDLSDLNELTGFWTQTSAAVSLEVSGTALSGGTIPLYADWNMIGYPATEARLVNDSVADIVSNLTIVWWYNATDTGDHWKKYDPIANPEANDLDYLTIGAGYWFKMTSDSNYIIDW